MAADRSYSSRKNTCGGGGGPFLGFYATLAKQGPSPQLPLSVRSAFRPVLTALPNTPLLLEAMLLSNGFVGARALVQGLVQGLRELRVVSPRNTTRESSTRRAAAAAAAAAAVSYLDSSSGGSGTSSSKVRSSADVATLLHAVAVKAVRTAKGLLAPETARELRAAKRKLGLASLTSSERKEKTEHISRAVEARALIAGFVRALLFEETGRDSRALKSQKRKKPTAPGSSGSRNTSDVPVLKGSATTAKETSDAGQWEIDTRRAAMVTAFQQTEILREILKPLDNMAVGFDDGAPLGRERCAWKLSLRAGAQSRQRSCGLPTVYSIQSTSPKSLIDETP